MDLKTLSTFHAIVKNGSFVRAAEELNYAQSTITMQVQKLESQVGVPLLERGKEIRLTEAGRLFYEQSLQIVHQMGYLQASMANLKSGLAGHVRLGVTEPTASYRLPRMMRDFLADHPNIQVSMEVSNTPMLSERIVREELDFALAASPEPGADLEFEPLFQEEFAAIMPEGHPLAEKGTLLPEDLCGHRLLITSSACPYRRKLERALAEKGVVLTETMEVGSMTALRHFVEFGLGIALVPVITLSTKSEGIVSRQVDGSLVHMACGIISKGSAYPFRSAAASRLYHYFKQELN